MTEYLNYLEKHKNEEDSDCIYLKDYHFMR